MSLIKHSLTQWFKSNLGLNCVVKTQVPPKGQPTGPPTLAVSVTGDSEKLLKHLQPSNGNKRIKSMPDYVTDIKLDSDSETEPQLLLAINRDHFASNLIGTINRDVDAIPASLLPTASKGRTVVVEFSSPNIAKSFHFGHLRSTLLGNFVANIEAALGHNVIRLNYLGDWGTQFGILSLGYDLYGNQNDLIASPCKHLMEVYVRINGECESNAERMEEAKKRFALLEAKADGDVYLQWRRFREYSVENYKAMYSRLGVNFDDIHGESMYSRASAEVIDQLNNLGLIEDSEDGSKMVALKGVSGVDYIGTKRCIPIIKRDGSTLYITRDIAAAIHRKSHYNFDQMYYVVENGQQDHFVNLKNVLNQMGCEWESQLKHIKFGRIHGMSSRKGTAVLLDDILEEAKERALESTRAAKNSKLVTHEHEDIAQVLGVSALLVNVMMTRNQAHYRFDWDRAVQQNRDSGIALQYSHARLCSLEVNCGLTVDSNQSQINFEAIDCVEGVLLLLHLSKFDEVILRVYEEHEPCFLVNYLFKLSHCVSRAIKVLQVKNQPHPIGSSRLLLFRSSRNVLRKGMLLLGLKPLERM